MEATSRHGFVAQIQDRTGYSLQVHQSSDLELGMKAQYKVSFYRAWGRDRLSASTLLFIAQYNSQSCRRFVSASASNFPTFWKVNQHETDATFLLKQQISIVILTITVRCRQVNSVLWWPFSGCSRLRIQCSKVAREAPFPASGGALRL